MFFNSNSDCYGVESILSTYVRCQKEHLILEVTELMSSMTRYLQPYTYTT